MKMTALPELTSIVKNITSYFIIIIAELRQLIFLK